MRYSGITCIPLLIVLCGVAVVHVANRTIRLHSQDRSKQLLSGQFIITDEAEDVTVEAYVANEKVGVDFKQSMEAFITSHPETFIPCRENPKHFQYCQEHYLLTWTADSRSFAAYQTTPFLHSVRANTTIIIHSSVNRLHYLKDITTRWTGPISLALYVKWSEMSVVDRRLYQIQQKGIRIVLYVVDDRKPADRGTNCVYHDDNSTTPVSLTCDQLNATIYPINTLRNLAINFVTTTHYLNLDMDLWPSHGLYEKLSTIPDDQLNEDRIAFVLPAFQFTPKEREICRTTDDCFSQLSPKLPATKPELLKCMRSQICQIANGFLPTHRFVDKEWWTFPKPVQVLSCKPFAIMEPYCLLRRTPSTPLYDDNFINYGYNKVQFIDELQYKGYVFSVLTVGFGFDIPHKPSVYADMYEYSWKIKQVINEDVYKDFLQRLAQQPQEKRQEVCDRTAALKKYTNSF